MIASVVASRNDRFVRLGLTDTVFLEAVKPETPFLTVDFEPYLAALENKAAVNFDHHRNLWSVKVGPGQRLPGGTGCGTV